MKNKERLWKISPSSLYGYVDCKTCFWIYNNLGSHPFTLPLRLNDAMDAKMKSRYDMYRKKGQMPPELDKLKGYKLFDGIKTLEDWRTKSSLLAYKNEDDGYILAGKLDEVLVNSKGKLVPSDYKSSGDPPRREKYKYYELQLHAYAVMIEDKGYSVSNEAFLLHYFPKDRENTSLNVKLDFHIDRIKINKLKFLDTMRDIVKFLEGPCPVKNDDCKRCRWLKKLNS